MSNQNLDDEIKTDIENFLKLENFLHSVFVREVLEESLKTYCDENNVKIDIKKTVEEFLTKRGKL